MLEYILKSIYSYNVNHLCNYEFLRVSRKKICSLILDMALTIFKIVQIS